MLKTRDCAVLGLTLLLGFAPTRASAAEPPLTGLLGPTVLSDVAERVTPAVVNITTKKLRTTAALFDGPRGLRDLFGPGPGPRHEMEVGAGSGVVISADGYIVTNNHVVDQADEIKVAFADKREFDAKLVGNDSASDLALIKIEAANLPSLPFGNSTKLRLGEIVLAIGNPYGVGQTVTMGIVSAKGRSPQISRTVEYEDFIQTDAAINPGNSGGALVNLQGELVGVNTAIISRGGGGSQGIGFAVPSNMIKPILEQVREYGRVRRGWLGVAIQDINPSIAREFELKETKGIIISDVVPKGPAAAAKIKPNDVIVAVNDQPATNASDLRNGIALMKPGTKVKFSLLRENKKVDVTVTLDEKKSESTISEAEEKEPSPMLLAGLTVIDLDSDIRRRLTLPASMTGVLVMEVEEGSAAERAQLSKGDIITAVGRHIVHSSAEFSKLVGKDPKDLVLRVYRLGLSTFVTLR
jgi:serine protease Do